MGRSRSRSPSARRGGSREPRKRPAREARDIREVPREAREPREPAKREPAKRERRRSPSRSSRSPYRRRSRSPRRPRSDSVSPTRHASEPILSSPPPMSQRKVKPKEVEVESDQTPDEMEMMATMGFSNFETSKGKHMAGSSNAHAVNISLKRKYRQYMNRKGGFNRPLDFIA
ncbi:U4/U6.U5 small nuclear ribonucleoprotein 27 kDa protein [Lampetra fluviatilis]